MIVQDADRLDALGAIGIARIFAYGSAKGDWEIYSPNLKPKLHRNFSDYKNSQTTSINHFYEKILLLKNRLNTKTAKKIARERDQFVHQYLKEFFREWREATFWFLDYFPLQADQYYPFFPCFLNNMFYNNLI